MELSDVDRRILTVIKKSGPITTYRVAKETNVSWPTAVSHCYKLKSLGLINEKIDRGIKESIFWSFNEA